MCLINCEKLYNVALFLISLHLILNTLTMKRFFVFACVAICTVSFLTANTSVVTKDDDPDIIINDMIKRVEFFVEDGDLKATISYDYLVEATTAVNSVFVRNIFKDNTSEVSKVKSKRPKKASSSLKLAFSDYESNGIFHSDMRNSRYTYTFNKNDGQVNIKYQKTFHDIKFLDPIYFNDVYEVDNSRVEIIVPDWLDLDIVEWNFDKDPPTMSKEKTKKGTSYIYNYKDLLALYQYRGQPGRSKFSPHLILIPESYKNKGKKIRGMQETADLYNWYAGLVNNMKDDSKVLKGKVAELVKDKTTDEEKIKSIFYWVQDNIRYIAFEYGLMGFQPEECQYVYENRYGDCKGMANLTKQMLTIAGYDARLTWIGTNSLPYNYDLPSLMVDNHMICTVILDGERIYLDATEKYADLRNYAQRIQGKQVLIENGKDFFIDSIPRQDNKINHEQIVHKLSVSAEDGLVGEGDITFTGANKSSMMYRLSTIPQKEWEDALLGYIGNNDKNVRLEMVELPDLKQRSEEFNIKYKINIDNHITNLGTEMYFSPEIDRQLISSDMPEERDVPFEFRKRYLIEYDVQVDIPAGWVVSYLPEAVSLDAEKYEVKLSYKEENGKIQYTKKIDIKDNTIEVSEFDAWNKSIALIKTFYEDQIILKKK